MRVSGAGHEKLMVVVPMGVVFVLSIIAMGGPAPLLETLDRHLGNFFSAAWEWLCSVL